MYANNLGSGAILVSRETKALMTFPSLTHQKWQAHRVKNTTILSQNLRSWRSVVVQKEALWGGSMRMPNFETSPSWFTKLFNYWICQFQSSRKKKQCKPSEPYLLPTRIFEGSFRKCCHIQILNLQIRKLLDLILALKTKGSFLAGPSATGQNDAVH